MDDTEDTKAAEPADLQILPVPLDVAASPSALLEHLAAHCRARRETPPTVRTPRVPMAELVREPRGGR